MAGSADVWRSIRRIIWRYLPSEIGGTATALCAAGLTYWLSNSLAAAAIAGSLGEAAGYYGVTGVREIRQYYRHHLGKRRMQRAILSSYLAFRGMMVEFGPAELIDSLIVRPFLFYVIPQETHTTWAGWVVAKICADVFFYGFVAVGYRMRKQLGFMLARQEGH